MTPTTDLIARLRARADFFDSLHEFDAPSGRVEREAADALTAQEAELARLREALEKALDALECADATLERITEHHPKTPGLHFDNLDSLIESAVGIAEQRREAIAPILAASAPLTHRERE